MNQDRSKRGISFTILLQFFSFIRVTIISPSFSFHPCNQNSMHDSINILKEHIMLPRWLWTVDKKLAGYQFFKKRANFGVYIFLLIEKTEVCVKRLHWRAFYFLNPDLRPMKETYRFKSTHAPPRRAPLWLAPPRVNQLVGWLSNRNWSKCYHSGYKYHFWQGDSLWPNVQI